MICNRRAFVLATGCPQISVNISFPSLSFCSTPDYTEPRQCEACTPKMLPEPDINFPGAQKCISFYLTLSAIDPDDTPQPIYHTNGCFSARIVSPIRLPCFRKIFTRSSGNNNGTLLLFTVMKNGCDLAARFSSAFSLDEPTKYMARLKTCIIPTCLNITLTPLVVGYGIHDADDIGRAVVQFGENFKLDDIELQFPLMCDLPPPGGTRASMPGKLVRMYWKWNNEQKWKITALIEGPCDLRSIDVDPPITAVCTNGEYHISVLFTRFAKPDPEDFRGSKGQTGPSGDPGMRGPDASIGDIVPCTEDPGHACDNYDDAGCGCSCKDPDTFWVNCPFGEAWYAEISAVALFNMWFTSDGMLIASQQVQHFAVFNSCAAVINHSWWIEYEDLPTFKLAAPVGVPELEE